MIKIYYTIHEEGCIDVEEDEEFQQALKDCMGNIDQYAEAEVISKTRYFNTDNISIKLLVSAYET
jgi:hypothetical protein